MFIGHFALGFAAKRLVPRVSLAALFGAAQFADLLWPFLLATGLEEVRIDPGNTRSTPLDFVSYPYSHSLLTLIVWGALFGWMAARMVSARRVFGVIFALVVSHWLLDYITHRPDMPLYPGGPKLGLGLWNHPALEKSIEITMYAAGVWTYLHTTRTYPARKRWAVLALAALLFVGFFAASAPPPSVTAIWISAIALSALTLAWAYGQIIQGAHPMPEPLEAAVGPVSAQRAGIWEDFIDIFYAPSQVFARRQNGSFMIPLVVVAFLVGVLFYLNSGAMQPIMDAEFDRAMAAAMRRNPALNAEAVQRIREFGLRLQQIFIFVIMPLTMFAIGLCLWLIGKLFEARQTLRAALVVASYSYMPRVLEAVLNGLQAMMLDPAGLNGRFRISLGPGRFIDPDTASPILLAIVGRMDVFTIWVTVLLAIGLSVTGNIPRSRAAIAAVLIWAIGAVPLIIQAVRTL